MKITINGKLFADNSLDYDRIHQMVKDNTYDSIGDAVISKVTDAIHKTEWYQHTPNQFDLSQNFNHVQNVCRENLNCYWDAANWTIMDKTEVTADIYKFISDRMAVIREGFQYNFLPKHIDFHTVLDLIDWHFILDCISWFF